MIHDQLNRPYLYIPNKEGGLPIYDIGTVTNAVLAGTIPTSQFGNLVVMNVSQDGNYRYLALGNSFTSPQA